MQVLNLYTNHLMKIMMDIMKHIHLCAINVINILNNNVLTNPYIVERDNKITIEYDEKPSYNNNIYTNTDTDIDIKIDSNNNSDSIVIIILILRCYVKFTYN